MLGRIAPLIFLGGVAQPIPKSNDYEGFIKLAILCYSSTRPRWDTRYAPRIWRTYRTDDLCGISLSFYMLSSYQFRMLQVAPNTGSEMESSKQNT